MKQKPWQPNHITRAKGVPRLRRGGRRTPATSDGFVPSANLAIIAETACLRLAAAECLAIMVGTRGGGATPMLGCLDSPSQWHFSTDGSLCVSPSSVFTSLSILFHLQSSPSPLISTTASQYAILSPVALSLSLDSKWPVTCFDLPYRSQQHDRRKPRKAQIGITQHHLHQHQVDLHYCPSTYIPQTFGSLSHHLMTNQPSPLSRNPDSSSPCPLSDTGNSKSLEKTKWRNYFYQIYADHYHLAFLCSL